jgi:hypothetical protein
MGKGLFQIALEGAKPDRIPIICGNNNSFLCHFYDKNVSQIVKDHYLMAELYLRFARDFCLDLIHPSVGYIFYGCGPELGVNWKFVESEFPGAVAGCIENMEDLEQFQIPKKPLGYFKKLLDIHRIFVQESAESMFVRGVPLGPFSSGCFLRGLQNFLLDTIENISFFRKVMETCAILSSFFVQQISSTGVDDMVLNEVFLTPGNLDPRFFHYEVNPHIENVLKRETTTNVYFYQKDFLANGQLGDGTSKKELASAIYYGYNEDLDVIRQALKLPVPGYPPLITVSGRSLVYSSIDDIIEFIHKGINIIFEEGGCNPCINLSSVQASSKKEALEITKKLENILQWKEKITI